MHHLRSSMADLTMGLRLAVFLGFAAVGENRSKGRELDIENIY